MNSLMNNKPFFFSRATIAEMYNQSHAECDSELHNVLSLPDKKKLFTNEKMECAIFCDSKINRRTGKNVSDVLESSSRLSRETVIIRNSCDDAHRCLMELLCTTIVVEAGHSFPPLVIEK